MIKLRKALSAMLIGGMFSGLYAAGTIAGTEITSTATLTYGSGVEGEQQQEAKATSTFVVDNKVDLSVTENDAAAVEANAGETGVVLSFKVQNTGNYTQDFALSAVYKSGITFNFEGVEYKSQFEALNAKVVVDTGEAGYNPAEDTVTYIDELAPDEEVTVFIVADMPSAGTLENEMASIYDLKVQVAEGGQAAQEGTIIAEDSSNEIDAPDTIQIVFADSANPLISEDAAHDGIYLSREVFKILVANMAITKQSVVISDTLGSTNPKRIPGAVIRYCFTVSNNGGADVAVADIKDTLDTSIYNMDDMVSASVKIIEGAGFDCAKAELGAENTGVVIPASGEVNIVLDGVTAGQTKNAYFNVTLK